MARAFAITFAVALAACGSGSWQPSASCGRAETTCSTHADCCSYACIGGACRCAPVGEHCLADVACCGGSVCIGDVCSPGCRAAGIACESAGDCCDGDCVDGVCGGTSCQRAAETCTASMPCCSGLACDRGTCVTSSCKPVTSTCASPAECCGGGCVGSACCVIEGNTCGDDSQCCSGLICDGTGHCAPCGMGGDSCYDGDCCAPSYCAGNVCCGAPGEGCTTPSQCCGQITARCTAQSTCCIGAYGPCTVPSDCCSGACTNKQCEQTRDGDACTDSADCIQVPNNSSCVGGRCCRPTSAACNLNSECCSGSCKPNNTCT